MLAFASGALVHRSEFFAELKMLLDSGIFMTPMRALDRLPADVEVLSLNIKAKHYEKLVSQRNQALKQGVLFTSNKDFVPVLLRWKDVSVKAKIRLKGDHTDHLENDTWSFRIRIKNNRTINGMNHFSIQHPKTKSYLLEWLFHRALKKEGIPAIRYKFIAVEINGENKGIYALEENFEKRLIENNGRREGPIVRFSEDIMWKERHRKEQTSPRVRTNDDGSYMSAPADTFDSKNLMGNGDAAGQHKKAMALLEAFRRGVLPSDKVFDLSVTARYFALNDLFGAEHGARWHNARFYYNPVTSFLEPIGFDAFEKKGPHPITRLVGSIDRMGEGGSAIGSVGSYYYQMFHSPKMFSAYISELERVSKKGYVENFLAGIEPDMKQALHILHSNFPHYTFSPQRLLRNQVFIRTYLNPVRIVHAFNEGGSKSRIGLSVGNLQPLPLELLRVSWKGGEAPILDAPLMPGKRKGRPVEYMRVHFNSGSIQGKKQKPLKIHFRILGSSKDRKEKIFPWPFPNPAPVAGDLMRKESDLAEHSFLRVDKETKKIFIDKGNWIIDKDLIFPPGYTVIASGGTELDLINSALVLSYSPLKFIGTEENPIVISSSDTSGQGLIVLKTQSPSLLQHVIIKGLSFPNRSDWSLRGTVTFYEAEAKILHCQFIRNRGEDALNLIRCDFLVKFCLFDGAFSDSLDSDFCKGQIVQSVFLNSGNDAVDFSQSDIVLRGLRIVGAGDKGISAGEMSHVEGRKIYIENAAVAVASKDWSQVQLRNLRMEACSRNLEVYQKKPEYGPGSMEVWGLHTQGGGQNHYIEEGSSLKIEGKQIPQSTAKKIQADLG